jgi:hypothetical protein
VKSVLAFLLCAVSVVAQTSTAPVGGVVIAPVTLSNIVALPSMPVGVLLAHYPIIPANQVLAAALANFTFNLTVGPDATIQCQTIGAYASGGIGLACTTLPTTPVTPPAAPAPPIVTQVNQGTCSQVTPINEVATCPLWAVGSGNGLFVWVSGGSAGNTVTSVNAVAGNSMYPMKLASSFAGRKTLQLYYLPNTPAGITSLQLLSYEADTSTFNVSVDEYSGLSTATAPVGTPFGVDSGYTSSSTFSAGPYTPPAASLVLSATSSTIAGTWTAGWTSVNSIPGLLVQSQINPSGALTATGTYASGYQYFDTAIVAFQ